MTFAAETAAMSSASVDEVVMAFCCLVLKAIGPLLYWTTKPVIDRWVLGSAAWVASTKAVRELPGTGGTEDNSLSGGVGIFGGATLGNARLGDGHQ